MNSEDIYKRHEHLMTDEEVEEFYYEGSEPDRCKAPKLWEWLHPRDGTLNDALLGGNFEDVQYRAQPCSEDRKAFENRPPALGATPQLLAELKVYNEKLPQGGVQQRLLYQAVRYKMLHHLISCDGAKSTEDLVDILQKEMDSGVHAPVPDWYTFPSRRSLTDGPNVGYDRCSNWLCPCYRTETHDKPPFLRCSQCKIAMYCSKECQANDWKARHKKVCKEAKMYREKMKHNMALIMGAGGCESITVEIPKQKRLSKLPTLFFIKLGK